jgi:hypothetical protein
MTADLLEDFLKRFNLYEIFCDKTKKMWPFNTGYCLIEVIAWEILIEYKESIVGV